MTGAEERPLERRKGLLNYNEAAEYLGVTPRHVKRLREYGQIEYIKVGRLVRFRPEALDNFVESHAVPVAEAGVR